MRTEPPAVDVNLMRPVFVAGPDRSGTTLMFALLASHPDLSMTRRTNMWRYFHRRYGDLGNPANLDRCLDEMMRYRRMRHLEPDEARIRREFAAGPPTYGRLFALFHAHHAQQVAKPRWGDKSLHNEHFATAIFSEFPEARIVHMIRDPRDRYASVRRRNGQELSRVGAATGRWLQSTRAALRHRERYPDRYLIVRYEDLTRAPHETMRMVCEFIGVDYDPDMMQMNELPELRDSGGNSSFGDMEPGAISVRAIGRYRSVVPPCDVQFIQLVAGRAMARMGYQRDSVRLEGRERIRYGAWELPINSMRMVGWMTQARFGEHRGVAVPRFRLEPVKEEVNDDGA
jgi:hypothetical protein